MIRLRKLFDENIRNLEEPAFDLFSSKVRRDPYPYYRILRRHFPVHYFKKHGFWAVSRYQDVVSALKRPDLFSAIQKGARLKSINNSDPPEHTRLRRIGSSFFTDRYIAALEERIRSYTNQCIENIRTLGTFDLMADFATKVPLFTIETMLGIDPKHSDDLTRWIDHWMIRHSPVEKNDSEFEIFLADHIATCQRDGEGILSTWLHATSENEKMKSEEAIEIIKLFLLAGSLTTSHLVGNAVLALLRHPEQMKMVCAEPGLIPLVIEETLRYDSPAPFVPRTVMQNVEFSGAQLKAGDSLWLLLGSANRDELQFENSEVFLIQRNVQRHVAFADGIHYCLGARLARLEASIMMEALLLQLPRFQAAEHLGQVELIDSTIVRGPKRLPLTFRL